MDQLEISSLNYEHLDLQQVTFAEVKNQVKERIKSWSAHLSHTKKGDPLLIDMINRIQEGIEKESQTIGIILDFVEKKLKGMQQNVKNIEIDCKIKVNNAVDQQNALNAQLEEFRFKESENEKRTKGLSDAKLFLQETTINEKIKEIKHFENPKESHVSKQLEKWCKEIDDQKLALFIRYKNQPRAQLQKMTKATKEIEHFGLIENKLQNKIKSVQLAAAKIVTQHGMNRMVTVETQTLSKDAMQQQYVEREKIFNMQVMRLEKQLESDKMRLQMALQQTQFFHDTKKKLQDRLGELKGNFNDLLNQHKILKIQNEAEKAQHRGRTRQFKSENRSRLEAEKRVRIAQRRLGDFASKLIQEVKNKYDQQTNAVNMLKKFRKTEKQNQLMKKHLQQVETEQKEKKNPKTKQSDLDVWLAVKEIEAEDSDEDLPSGIGSIPSERNLYSKIEEIRKHSTLDSDLIFGGGGQPGLLSARAGKASAQGPDIMQSKKRMS